MLREKKKQEVQAKRRAQQQAKSAETTLQSQQQPSPIQRLVSSPPIQQPSPVQKQSLSSSPVHHLSRNRTPPLKSHHTPPRDYAPKRPTSPPRDPAQPPKHVVIRKSDTHPYIKVPFYLITNKDSFERPELCDHCRDAINCRNIHVSSQFYVDDISSYETDKEEQIKNHEHLKRWIAHKSKQREQREKRVQFNPDSYGNIAESPPGLMYKPEPSPVEKYKSSPPVHDRKSSHSHHHEHYHRHHDHRVTASDSISPDLEYSTRLKIIHHPQTNKNDLRALIERCGPITDFYAPNPHNDGKVCSFYLFLIFCSPDHLHL
jgi:hypothetical protein